MKRFYNLLPQLIIASAAMFFIVSCADAPKRETEKENTEESTKEKMMEDKSSSQSMEEDLSFMLPSPIQIAAIFNRAGLEYKGGLTNSVDNITKYNTKTSKYLNFGVYSADLAYTVLNNQQQSSIDYLNAVKSMADEIGMPSIFGSGKLIESFEKNIGNQDTILRILTVIKRRTDQYLEENSEKSKEAIFFSAAWVEGMYLGANSPSKKSKLTPRLIEQMTILENVIKALKVQNDESLDLAFLIDGLSKLENTFNGFESIKKMDINEVELSEVSLTDTELQTLTDQINALRAKIVNG